MKTQQSGKSTVSNRAKRDEVETLHFMWAKTGIRPCAAFAV